MTIQVIAIVPTEGAAETLSLGFDNSGAARRLLDELLRKLPAQAAVALAVEGRPVDLRRRPDGRIVIDEALIPSAP